MMENFRYEVQTNGREVIAGFHNCGDAIGFAKGCSNLYRGHILVVYDRQEQIDISEHWGQNTEIINYVKEENDTFFKLPGSRWDKAVGTLFGRTGYDVKNEDIYILTNTTKSVIYERVLSNFALIENLGCALSTAVGTVLAYKLEAVNEGARLRKLATFKEGKMVRCDHRRKEFK